MQPYVIQLKDLGLNDIDTVGGKNASLGEMIANLSSAGVSVPGGFASTAQAYREFLQQDGLAERIDALLQKLDTDNIEQLTTTGAQIRQWVLDTPLPEGPELGGVASVSRGADGCWHEGRRGSNPPGLEE